MKVENHLGHKLQITHTPAVTSYMVCCSVFEEAEYDYMSHNLPFNFLFWKKSL